MADPFWQRFCTPLAERILALIQSPTAGPAQDAPYILEETIDQVLADGRYLVGGDALTTKGTAKLRVGQRVHVFWRAGRRERILTHQWQRAQTGGHPIAVGLVEELILTADQRLFFRNDAQVTDLQLASLLAGHGSVTFGLVRWGQRDNTFFLQTALRPTRYFIFQLDRPSGQGAGAARVTATLLTIVSLPTVTLPSSMQDVLAVNLFAAAGGYPWPLYHTWSLTARPRVFPADAPLVDAVLTETPTGELDMVLLAQVPTVVEEPFPWNASFAQQRYYDALVVIQAGTGAVLWTSPITAAVRGAGDDIRLDQARLIRWDLRSDAGLRAFVSRWVRQSRFMTGEYFMGHYNVSWPNLGPDGEPKPPEGAPSLQVSFFGEEPLPGGPFDTYPQVVLANLQGHVYTVTSTPPRWSFRLDGPSVAAELAGWSETDRGGLPSERPFTARSLAWLKTAPGAAALVFTALVPATPTRVIVTQPSTASLVVRIAGLAFMAPDLAYAITEADAATSRPDEREHFIAWPPGADAGASFLAPGTAGAQPWARGPVPDDQERLHALPADLPAISFDYHAVEGPELG